MPIKEMCLLHSQGASLEAMIRKGYDSFKGYDFSVY